MSDRKLIYFILTTLLATALILGVIVLAFKNKNELKVFFLDVGQGDAILIESGNNQVLIDAGRSGKTVLDRLGKVMPFWDRKIEVLLITHPDADHYGGFNEIINNYKVENVIKTDVTSTSGEWLTLIDKLKNKRVTEIKSTQGTAIVFPSGARLNILYPFFKNIPSNTDKNDTSIVSKLVFGENKFLFTGDLSAEGENILLDKNINISANFLKVGHHGSHYSTGENFLEKVNPKDAIISVGKNNSYGHPHQEILDRFKNRMIQVWRTDQDGIIEYDCKNINQPCQAMKYPSF
ncbi:MAG: ComEC/Rec2 family competence protein [Parcubacteria group bacterium]|jgi:competence protein ComEC